MLDAIYEIPRDRPDVAATGLNSVECNIVMQPRGVQVSGLQKVYVKEHVQCERQKIQDMQKVEKDLIPLQQAELKRLLEAAEKYDKHIRDPANAPALRKVWDYHLFQNREPTVQEKKQQWINEKRWDWMISDPAFTRVRLSQLEEEKEKNNLKIPIAEARIAALEKGTEIPAINLLSYPKYGALETFNFDLLETAELYPGGGVQCSLIARRNPEVVTGDSNYFAHDVVSQSVSVQGDGIPDEDEKPSRTILRGPVLKPRSQWTCNFCGTPFVQQQDEESPKTEDFMAIPNDSIIDDEQDDLLADDRDHDCINKARGPKEAKGGGKKVSLWKQAAAASAAKKSTGICASLDDPETLPRLTFAAELACIPAIDEKNASLSLTPPPEEDLSGLAFTCTNPRCRKRNHEGGLFRTERTVVGSSEYPVTEEVGFESLGGAAASSSAAPAGSNAAGVVGAASRPNHDVVTASAQRKKTYTTLVFPDPATFLQQRWSALGMIHVYDKSRPIVRNCANWLSGFVRQNTSLRVLDDIIVREKIVPLKFTRTEEMLYWQNVRESKLEHKILRRGERLLDGPMKDRQKLVCKFLSVFISTGKTDHDFYFLRVDQQHVHVFVIFL